MSKRAITSKKLQEEQQAIGAIYKKYIDTFQQPSDIPRKTFVRSDTLYAADGKQQDSEKGRLYNPEPIIKLKKEEPHLKTSNPNWSGKRAKKKSNLKSLGDELKILQHERQSRELKLLSKMDKVPCSVDDYGTSTNLFISNLSPQITESRLIELFGVYGPLASVKIMWPRNETGKSANNCGFVAFMSRVDAERAMNALSHHQEMRINWGKAVKLPTHPVHIPTELYELYSPPPPSGLPFNAQPQGGKTGRLEEAVIRVTIPFDRNLVMTIHRTIEFVVREGPEFESLLVNVEAGNPEFNFLTDYQSPAHTYYRWKLYSILNGDPKNCWPLKPFRMYQNGSIWIPPIAPNYKNGMPKELLVKTYKSQGRNLLSDSDADKLVALIKNLTTSRRSVAHMMVFCLNRVNVIDAVLDLIVDSFSNLSTNPLKKVARLYLLSDVLYNCKMKNVPLAKFGEESPSVCLDVFKHVHDTYRMLTHPQDKDCLKVKILMILRAWVFYDFYEVDFITKLENVFLYGTEMGGIDDDDNSLVDEPLDGTNLLKRSLQSVSSDCFIVEKTFVNDTEKNFIDIFK